MTRQGTGYVITGKTIKAVVAVFVTMTALGPALGAGVAYIVRDVSQQKDIEHLKETYARIDTRLERIESALMVGK